MNVLIYMPGNAQSKDGQEGIYLPMHQESYGELIHLQIVTLLGLQF